MKRLFAILTLILCVALLASCNSATKGMTAEEVVEEYFTRFDNKDKNGMDALVADQLKGLDAKLDQLNYVNLMRTEDTTATYVEDVSFEVRNNVYEMAVVDVSFDIMYNDNPGQVAGFENAIYNGRFYLSKKDENSGFTIVRWDILGKADNSAEAQQEEAFNEELENMVEQAKENLVEE